MGNWEIAVFQDTPSDFKVPSRGIYPKSYGIRVALCPVKLRLADDPLTKEWLALADIELADGIVGQIIVSRHQCVYVLLVYEKMMIWYDVK